MNLPLHVGMRIKAIRKSKGWTQEQLAEHAGLQYTYIGGVERGDRNITMETLEKVILALDVDAVDLFRIELSDPKDQYKREAMDSLIATIGIRSAAEIRGLTRVVKSVIETWADLNE